MLRSHLPISIDTLQTNFARQYLPLLLGKKFIAMSTFMKVILFLFQQKLKLLHEQPGHNFVFTLFEAIHSVKGDFLGHLSYDVGVDALHVDLNA